MDANKILPDIGSPVVLHGLKEDDIDDMSIGELVYATTLLQQKLARRMADPATAHEFATFTTAVGADWSGYRSPSQVKWVDGSEDAEDIKQPVPGRQADSLAPAQPVPAAPENYYDSLPGIADMLRQQQHATDAILTHFARHLEPGLGDQAVYLGTPIGVKAYKDGPTYFREVLRISRQQTKKIHDRLPYLTWSPGKDPELLTSQPKLRLVARSFADGDMSAENADRIIALDQDLTKYARKVGQTSAYKDEVLRAFEPTLVEAGESATPDELSEAKSRWANKIANAIDPDGPPVADALRKEADNAIKTQNYTDGSGRIWTHVTAPVYAAFKNFCLHQLNKNGTPVKIDEGLLDFLQVFDQDLDEVSWDDPAEQPLHDETGEEQLPAVEPADTFDNIDDQSIDRDPTAPAAEDAAGNIVTTGCLDRIEQLTTGQRLGAILIGMFQNLLAMDPRESQIKKAHGASAQLTIIQDIETAYHTLGIGALPEAVRRRKGAAAILPAVIKRPYPDDSDTPICLDQEHTLGYRSPPSTAYISEVLNIGSFHPKHAEILCCDSKIVGQIWNEHHEVLDQRREYRIFTAAQRQAILARDRGCQAPGCTVPAIYCQIHHILAWLLGGPTDVDNAITLCAIHHAAVHNGKWLIRTHNGIHFFQPAPWLEPTQPLLRNLYWSL